MVKVHTPAAAVCAGRPLNVHVLVLAPDWIWHVVPRAPTAWSTVLAAHAGAVPDPCRYSGLPAALTTGACVEAITRLPNISTSTAIANQPTQRVRRTARATGGVGAGAI